MTYPAELDIVIATVPKKMLQSKVERIKTEVLFQKFKACQINLQKSFEAFSKAVESENNAKNSVEIIKQCAEDVGESRNT